MSDAPMMIYEALAAVMAEVQSVAKRDKNTHQGFNFRGIDAVMNAVGPALRTHKVIVVPDVHSVAYADVTTSKGKPATACRVQVVYRFYATDASSISASVAGEAWDSGDKACPKAMSVAFRTALLQALCLPTDEPDPDSQTFERSTVDLSELERVIAEAQSLSIEGDYDGTREWAAQGQQNADVAAGKLRKAIAEKRAKDDESSGTQAGAPAAGTTPGERDASPSPGAEGGGADDGQAPADGDSEAEQSGEGAGSHPNESRPPESEPDASSPDTPAWRKLAEAEGVSDRELVIALNMKGVWPANDQASKPTQSRHLDTYADRHEGLYERTIEKVAEQKRQKVAS